MKEYMSGDELYRYLHISKRKMKYLLENGYIPMNDTGKKTHRYQVQFEDAESFLLRMQKRPESLNELAGKFSSRPNKSKLMFFEPTEENCKAFQLYLIGYFNNEPEAMVISETEKHTGMSRRYISSLCNRNVIWSVIIQGKRYCSKESLISYLSSANMIISPTKTKKYKHLLKEFAESRKGNKPCRKK